MANDRQRAIEALQALPENATIDDAIERLCFIAKVKESLQQSDPGQLVPPGTATRGNRPSRFEQLVAAGIIRAPLETGDPTEDWPDIRLPRGTAAELIDADRDDT